MTTERGGDAVVTNRPTTIDPRVVLAAERTLLAWIRTGLAAMGFGFVVARFGFFLRELAQSTGHGAITRLNASAVGVAIVIGGVGMNAWASFRHFRRMKRLHEIGRLDEQHSSVSIVGLATSVAGALLVAILVRALVR